MKVYIREMYVTDLLIKPYIVNVRENILKFGHKRKFVYAKCTYFAVWLRHESLFL